MSGAVPSRRSRRRRRRRVRRAGGIALALIVLAGTATVVGVSPGARASGSVASTAIDDVQAFWARTMPEVYGQAYEPIPDDRLFPYSSDDPPPACGGRGTTSYEQVAGNAFYCPVEDFVAWDVEQLVPRLEDRYGDFAVALVLAHEWGHVVQVRTRSTIDATIYLENQADCFAGAWARHVESGASTLLSADAGDLDTALGGVLEFRDPPGVDPSQDGAHGNGFDRVSAFQDGFEEGADQCATYESDPPPVTESPYTSYEDQANGGDVALADAIDLVQTDLDDYWADHLDGRSPVESLTATRTPISCAGGTDGGVLLDEVEYCATDRRVTYDPDALSQVYEATGDFGAGMVLAAEWSAGAQDALGFPIQGRAGRLLADCLTGTWAGDIARGARAGNGRGSGASQLSLSPGDLDEGIATFVGLGGSREERGSAFARVAAFRKGFFKGIDACTAGAV